MLGNCSFLQKGVQARAGPGGRGRARGGRHDCLITCVGDLVF